MAQDRDTRAPVSRAPVADRQPDVFAGPDVFAQVSGSAPNAVSATVAASPLDPARIMASVGEVPYEWSIESDDLVWGANAVAVLKLADPAALASGRSYAKLLGADNTRCGPATATNVSGSRTAAAGLRAQPAGRRAPMASSGSSTSGMPPRSG